MMGQNVSGITVSPVERGPV